MDSLVIPVEIQAFLLLLDWVAYLVLQMSETIN